MAEISEQIKNIEKEIRETPYHKGTEHHIGRLRARLSKLKDKQFEEGPASTRGSSTRGGFSVKKQGDATVVLVGPPSVGKSTLLNKLTNANSKIAPYDFTTVSVIPGMMDYKDARIQILDVPGLIKGAEEGKGRGREVLSVIRGCDLLLIMTDLADLTAFERISHILEKNGVRINKEPPHVIVDKKMGGGLIIHSNIKQELGNDVIKDVSGEMGIKNAEIKINEKVSIERLIDAFSTNRSYIRALYLVNKSDLITKRFDELIHRYNPILISAERDLGLLDLKEKIWECLNFVR